MSKLPENSLIPLKITLMYAVAGGLWIIFSDKVLALLFTDASTIVSVSIFKGWLFVIVTAAILFFLTRKYVTAVLHRDNTLLIQHTKAEEALYNQFKQLTTIFDSVNAIIYVADMETNELLYLNAYGSALLGEDWRGKSCCDVLQRSGEAPIFCGEVRPDDEELQQPYLWEFESSATGRWFQCIDRAIRWPDGRLVRMEIAFDISDRKELERMKDEMLSAVSHEMRTPLTAMLGYTEFILENELPFEKQQEYLRIVYNETERLSELICNFLDLQRLKMRAAPLNMNPLSVEVLIQEAATLFGATTCKQAIAVDCQRGLPQIVGSAAQLHQVLVNLVSNAMKYSPNGKKVTIGARSDRETVVMWVKDEGLGIAPELHEKIFERFYRIDNTDCREVGGTGLGLALVREIVSAHNGKVWLESEIGKGSTFYVQLPVVAE